MDKQVVFLPFPNGDWALDGAARAQDFRGTGAQCHEGQVGHRVVPHLVWWLEDLGGRWGYLRMIWMMDDEWYEWLMTRSWLMDDYHWLSSSLAASPKTLVRETWQWVDNNTARARMPLIQNLPVLFQFIWPFWISTFFSEFWICNLLWFRSETGLKAIWIHLGDDSPIFSLLTVIFAELVVRSLYFFGHMEYKCVSLYDHKPPEILGIASFWLQLLMSWAMLRGKWALTVTFFCVSLSITCFFTFGSALGNVGKPWELPRLDFPTSHGD